MTEVLRRTGISAVGDMPWGTHFCHFYQTRQDLLDIVVPYLKAGLENNEFCLWVTAEPFNQETRKALKRTIPGADRHLSDGDIEIFPYSQWYLEDGVFDAQRVLDAWSLKLAEALSRGYAGLRVAADEAWLGKKYWQSFSAYEQELNRQLGDQPMIVQCAYPLASNDAAAIFDVAHTHQFAIAERYGNWETLETPELKQAKAGLKKLNEQLEQRVAERTRELNTINAALRQENTQRKCAEKALRANQQLLQAIIDNTAAVIYVKDLAGRYLLINRRFEELFHITRESVVGRTDLDIFPPDQAQAFRAFDQRVLAAGTALEAEEVASQDGGLHTYISIKSPLLDTSGRPYAICGVSTDITEHKRIEAERHAREAAEAASRAKSEFLANMSHELRSPLNTILGFARLMARDPALPAANREDLGLILRSGEHLHALINDVLDLSRQESGRAVLDEADFDLCALLDELRGMFAPTAADKGLQLVFQPRPGLPRHVRTDPLKLRQVLINLMGNALKFTHEGSVTVRVEARAMPDGGADARELDFAVEDTGPGIAPDECSNLFSAFMQARAGRQAQEGTGLGLAISRGHVQRMGGDIRIDSQPGHGTTVRFHIPVLIAARPPPCPAPPRRVIGLAPGQRRYRILVVDDHAEARQLLMRLLGPPGFDLMEASNGQEAVEQALSWHPDLIWMDLRMPVLDGQEAARRILAAGLVPRPVIVALTASALEEERSDVQPGCYDDFLSKPFHEDELFALLEKHLGARFDYEDATPACMQPLDAPAATALPEILRVALEKALLRLDASAVDKAIEAIKAENLQLATTLSAWASEFQYERILSSIQTAGEQAE